MTALWHFVSATAHGLGQASGNPVLPLFAAQCARSAAEDIKKVVTGNTTATSFMIRDKAMADNIDFLLKTLYPNKKMMVWAHNYHIRHANSQVTTPANRSQGYKVHGEYLVERGWRSDMYTIGLLMYRGQAANNDRRVYSVTAAPQGSIEPIAYQARKHYMFFDMTSQTRSAATAWMFEPRVAKEWGTIPLLGIWRDQYDGILYIDAVNPPVYR